MGNRSFKLPPFTTEQFFAVFGRYNEAIWPGQIAAYAFGFGVVGFLAWRREECGRVVCVILAAMWLWTGVVYHWLHFVPINNAAIVFGALFVTQAALFAYFAVRGGLQFFFNPGISSIAGSVLISYAMIVYPIVGHLSGHVYPNTPVFGVTPCPVTIFTFGLLLLATPSAPWSLSIAPLIWSLIGGTAAFLLHVPQDWILLISGPVTAGLLWAKKRNASARSSMF